MCEWILSFWVATSQIHWVDDWSSMELCFLARNVVCRGYGLYVGVPYLVTKCSQVVLRSSERTAMTL